MVDRDIWRLQSIYLFAKIIHDIKIYKKTFLISVIKTYLRFPFIIKNLINLISENKKIFN